MINLQSRGIRHYSSSKLLQQKQQNVENMPKTSRHSPQGLGYQNHEDFNHRSSPLRKSQSMSLVLHGDPSTPTTYYIDQLERFRRNHEIKNKQERQKQKAILQQKLQQRRSLQLQRQQSIRKKQQDHLRNMIDKNTQALQAHRQGIIRNNSFNNSIPVNPINLKYEPNLRGLYLKEADNRAEVKKLVRGHHLQTMGTSGYNILNGSSFDHTNKYLEKNKQIQGLYQEGLQKFYDRLKIKLPSLEESQNIFPKLRKPKYQA